MENYGRKKLLKSKSGLKIIVTNDDHKSPFVVQEPEWIPDKAISHCTKCNVRFGLTTRKHHCRRCGHIYCSGCCNTRLELRRMCFIDPVRVCLDCEPQTKLECIFFEKHLKALLNGALFVLEDCHLKSETTMIHCKLSSDHRFLLFDESSIAPLDVLHIKSLQVSVDCVTGNKSLLISYLIDGQVDKVCLAASKEESSKKTSNLWIKAFQLAYSLIRKKENE